MKRALKEEWETRDMIAKDIEQIMRLAKDAAFKHSLEPVVRQISELGMASIEEREGQPLHLSPKFFMSRNRIFIALLSDTLNTRIWPVTPPDTGIQDLVNEVIDTYNEYNDIFQVLEPGLCWPPLDETAPDVVQDVEELRQTIHNMEDKTEFLANFEVEIRRYQEEQQLLSGKPENIDEQLKEFDAQWFVTEDGLGIDLECLVNPVCETNMSYVYVVEDKYALKKCKDCLDSQRAFNRVKNEIKMLTDNQCMMFVPFIGILWKKEKRELYIVTEYMRNGALGHSFLSRADGTQKTRIAFGLAKGLSILHRKKVMHRDIKAENILLDDNMFPRIADMGTAREISQCNLTRAVGTPLWMANEVQSSRTYTEKVDVYSYGRVLWQMLIRSGPVDDDDHSGPAELARLINRCVASQPDTRPNIDEVVRMFECGDVFFHGADVNEVWSYISQCMLESEDDWIDGESITLFFSHVKGPQTIEACERLLDVYEKNACSSKLDASYVDAVVSVARSFLKHPCDCEREVCILAKLLYKIIISDNTSVLDSFEEKQGYDVVFQLFEHTPALSFELIKSVELRLSAGLVRVTDDYISTLERYLTSQDLECSLCALNQWRILLSWPWDSERIRPKLFSVAEFVSTIPWDTGDCLKLSCEYLLAFSEQDPSILSLKYNIMGRLCECIGLPGVRVESKQKALKFIARVIDDHQPSDNDCKSLLTTLCELVPSLTGNEVLVPIRVLHSMTQHRSVCAAVFHSHLLETVKDVILQKNKPEELSRPFLDIISKISESNTLEHTDMLSLDCISREISGSDVAGRSA